MNTEDKKVMKNSTTVRLLPYLLYRFLKQQIRRGRAKAQLRINRFLRKPIRVIVGASATRQTGWIPTEEFFFDITNERSIKRFLGGTKIDSILAEHVIEHLTEVDFAKFLQIIPAYLSNSANIRIAVPDAMHPSPWYRRQLGIAGEELGAEDHKTFWDYLSICTFSQQYQFACCLLEYFDENGVFHVDAFDEEARGKVSRSFRNNIGRPSMGSPLVEKLFEGMESSIVHELKRQGITYSSLILDMDIRR